MTFSSTDQKPENKEIGGGGANFDRLLQRHSDLILDSRAKEVLAELEIRHFRCTHVRIVIIGAICSFKGDFSIVDLNRVVRRRSPAIGIASVYRTVKLLTEIDILERSRIWQGTFYYVLHLEHQHQAICRSCGQHIDFGGCDLEDIVREVEAATGFRVESHHLELVGNCQNCLPPNHALSSHLKPAEDDWIEKQALTKTLQPISKSTSSMLWIDKRSAQLHSVTAFEEEELKPDASDSYMPKD